MAYDEQLAGRIRQQVISCGLTEKKMFGGVGFFLDGNMCVGVWKDALVARIGADEAAVALTESGCSEFDVTGRPMRSWVLVAAPVLKDDRALAGWIDRALRFVQTLRPK